MYFANNEGLLSFDGTYWKGYPLPNKTILRSIAIDKNNRIYAGGKGKSVISKRMFMVFAI